VDDLIAVPLYGWLYQMDLECGCRLLTQNPRRICRCQQCGKALAQYPAWKPLRCGSVQ
jgi:hypothetical protein